MFKAKAPSRFSAFDGGMLRASGFRLSGCRIYRGLGFGFWVQGVFVVGLWVLGRLWGFISLGFGVWGFSGPVRVLRKFRVSGCQGSNWSRYSVPSPRPSKLQRSI